MIRSPVASTHMISVGYDEPAQTLEVEFSDGSVYQYYNIGVVTYDQLMQSPSKGQYLNVYIKNAYPYSRVA